MGLNVADAKVQHCQTAAEVRALARAVIERKRARRRPPRKIPINDLTPRRIRITIKRIVDFKTLTGSLPEPIVYPSVASIIDIVSRRYNVTKMDLVSERRTMNVVVPRQIACALARRLTPLSLPLIGRHLGNRDHTTVLHACNKIDALRAKNAAFDAELTELEHELGCVKPFERLTQQVKQVRVSPWLDQQVSDTLKYLAQHTSLSFDKITATINGQFGTALTKNACLGRARRLGVRRRTPSAEAA